MRLSFSTIILLLTIKLISQDTIFYNNDGKKTDAIEDFDYYKVITYLDDDSSNVYLESFFKLGNIRSIEKYSNYKKSIHDGRTTEWFESGKLSKDLNYNDGEFDGGIYTYWENGTIKRHDIYDNGELVEGHIWDSTGKEKEYTVYNLMPEYPGGIGALMMFLAQNTKYPAKAKKQGISGRVLVNFLIDKEGNVRDIKVIQGLSKEIDEEAIRVFSLISKWEPGNIDGKPMEVHYTIPLKFTLGSYPPK